MSRWAAEWASTSLWGIGEAPEEQKYCDLALDRVLAQMDDRPASDNFRTLMCILAQAFGDLENVAFEVRDGFNVTNAFGVQLDMIGSIVGLTRQGYADERYRTFLQIQIDLILQAARDDANWTGTHNNILSICRTFVGAGAAITLTNYAPYDFTLTVPGIVVAEYPTLIGFICKALYAGVYGNVFISVGSGMVIGSDSVVVPGGTIGSESVVVPGGTIGFTIAIGDTSGCAG